MRKALAAHDEVLCAATEARLPVRVNEPLRELPPEVLQSFEIARFQVASSCNRNIPASLIPRSCSTFGATAPMITYRAVRDVVPRLTWHHDAEAQDPPTEPSRNRTPAHRLDAERRRLGQSGHRCATTNFVNRFRMRKPQSS
jgi:hypothetical protein